MTPGEWLLLRLDNPPRLVVAQHPVSGAWHVMVRIDGGYGDVQDAVVAAERLDRELVELYQATRRSVGSDPR